MSDKYRKALKKVRSPRKVKSIRRKLIEFKNKKPYNVKHTMNIKIQEPPKSKSLWQKVKEKIQIS